MDSELSLQVRRRRVLAKAWSAIQKNARHSKSEQTKHEIAEFEADLQANLDRIARQLREKRFKFPPARGVPVPKDKKNPDDFRPLVVAKVESRIVQRAIHDVLTTVPAIQAYVHTPHSFGGVKKREDDNMSAVPAAVSAVLDTIQTGARFVIRSDISQFFTRISKSSVTKIIAESVSDPEFLRLFQKSISVELENMANLRSRAGAFPIEDIGVAQGNSLSPLLGNIILFDFDRELNKHPDIRCIRYIDDFIILAPNQQAAENTFQKACHILTGLGMSVSLPKTKRAALENGFEFLGIDFSNGLIRPSKKSQKRLLESIKSAIVNSRDAFRKLNKSGEFDSEFSLIRTLTRISGIMQGWGKHYYFCNDQRCFEFLDDKIEQLLRIYLASYREEREKALVLAKWRLLGIEPIGSIEREPFSWPKLQKIA